MRWLPLPRSPGRGKIKGKDISNFALLFQRYILWDVERRGRALKWELKKQEVFPHLREAFESNKVSGNLKRIVKALERREEEIARTFQGSLGEMEAKVCWRTVVGLGAASVLETGLTLHHIYGLPYLPASSFKGLVRSYALTEIAESLGVKPLDMASFERRRKEKHPTPMQLLEELLLSEKDEERERIRKRLCSDEKLAEEAPIREQSSESLGSKGRNFRSIFGSPDREGKVLFFDVYPTWASGSEPKLDLDIMNPHYGPYYTGKKPLEPPADYYSPVPIYFLTFGKGTRLRFRWASKEKELLEQVEKWLKEAVRILGVGAKTRAGYGELKPIWVKA